MVKLANILKRKNPYLFRAKHILTAEQLIKSLVDAHISSNEETIFGDWLEALAIFINKKVYDGRKSGITGIDLEFDLNGTRNIIAIKSGPNWGNNSQIAKVRMDFIAAKKALRTSNSGLHVVVVNGCCYGKDNMPDKGDCFKYCGQRFWEFISGENNLFIEIIEPLGHKAKERNDEYINSYALMINKFTKSLVNDFCYDSGEISWNKLVRFNSAASSHS